MTIEDLKAQDERLFNNIVNVLKHCKRYKQIPKNWYMRENKDGQVYREGKLTTCNQKARVLFSISNHKRIYSIDCSPLTAIRSCIWERVKRDDMEYFFEYSKSYIAIYMNGESFKFSIKDFI